MQQVCQKSSDPCPDGNPDWPLYDSASRYYVADYAASTNSDQIDLPNRARLAWFEEQDMWKGTA